MIRVLAIRRLVQWLGWVFETQGRKKERLGLQTPRKKERKKKKSSPPDVDTVVHTHPKVSFRLRLTVTPWFALTRTQRPPKTAELNVNMEPEESLVNESHCDP